MRLNVLIALLVTGVASAETPTYSKDIAPLLNKHCVECHRDGGIAPMSFTEYTEVRKFAAMIKEVVLDERMPPWGADPTVGHFSNERRLNADELATLIAWVDGRTPRGNPDDLPPPPVFASDWEIGEPDIVFEMPEEVTIDPEGVVPYLYFETPTNFTEDKWIKAAQARPGNPKVVHHIIVFNADAEARGRDATLGIGRRFIKGFAPGNDEMILPDGVAMKIPAGAKLVWQMHYTPTGKTETDRSQIGFVFADGPPEHEFKIGTAINRGFRIPPNENNHRVESSYTFPEGATLMSMTPHMHLRGKSFEYIAIYPDGREELLLSIPRYDFNWQMSYELAKPKYLPKGSKLHCVAHFDNSSENPANPDPEETVRWGDQTWEEMMIGWFSMVWGDASESFQGHTLLSRVFER